MLIILLFHHLEHLDSLRERHADQLNRWVGCNSHILSTTFIDFCWILWLLYCLTHLHNMFLLLSHTYTPVCPKWRYAELNSCDEIQAKCHALMFFQNIFVNISYSISLYLEQVLPNQGSKNLKMNFRAQVGCWVIRAMWIMMAMDKKTKYLGIIKRHTWKT